MAEIEFIQDDDLTPEQSAKADRALQEAGIQLDILLDIVREHNQQAERSDKKCPPGCIGGHALHNLSHFTDEGITLMFIVALDRMARAEPL